MSVLIPLHFDRSDVRMVMRDGVPWWVGIDVVAALGIVKAHQALAALEDYERGTYIVGTPSGEQEMIVINESGFYSLLFRSRKPIAAQFKRWLTCEVLPSIRKFGAYPPPPVLEQRPTQDWCDGIEKTLPGRFREERLRWESDNPGYFVAKFPSFSPTIVRAIEGGQGGIYKGDRIKNLIFAGIDVLYVLTGRYTISPKERRLIHELRHTSGADGILGIGGGAPHLANP